MFELLLYIASALIGSGILLTHKRMLTYLAFAGVLFEAELLLVTFLRRAFVETIDGPTAYLIGGIAFITLWTALYKHWKSPYAAPGSGTRDGYVGITLLVLIALAYPIIQSNGFIGDDFVMHGFYNGDTVTFGSLIQKSFQTSRLVHENPFAANGALEYPTLLHGTFADFFSLMNTGVDWLRYLGIMTYAQILLTVPMFFLVWDTVFPEPKNPAERWFGLSSRAYVYGLQVVVTLIAIFLSLDSYVYPQSHFFLMALFLGIVSLLIKASTLSGKSQILPTGVALVCAALLLMANTVTGTVAVACIGTLAFIRVFDKKRGVQERVIFIIIGLATITFMHWASVGRTAFNNPHFSVSSAGDMLRAGLPMLFVLEASIYSLSRKQYVAITSILIASLGFITFLLADRNIVTENASRFLYHGFLIGFPLLLAPLIQILYSVKRELHLTSRPYSEIIAGYVAIACILGILLLPIGVSAGSTYINLLRNDKHIITFDDRIAMYSIESKTKPQDVIITSPNEPYAIPLFTGRSVLRLHDYWLSPQDEITKDVVDAFAGNRDSQQRILEHGDYLFLSKKEATSWDISKLKKGTESANSVMYRVK